jgi:hypothetical protein
MKRGRVLAFSKFNTPKMFKVARGGKRRGGRKNAVRLAKAALARERARQEDVLADVPYYTAEYARAPEVPELPFEAQARELVAYLTLMREEHGDEWLTEEEIGDELLQAAGRCECADETAILDDMVPALRDLIIHSSTYPPAMLTAVSTARFGLERLNAPSPEPA